MTKIYNFIENKITICLYDNQTLITP